MAVSALPCWLHCQALLWLPGLAALAWFGPQELPRAWPAVWLLAMGASFLALAWLLRAGRSAADKATMARFVGLLAVCGFGVGHVGVVLWVGAVVVVLLDLVDGALARRYGGSPGGAVLDMEADQMAVLGLAVVLVSVGGAVHVLMLPALRYVFVLAMWWSGAPAHEPKPVNGDNRRGRRVCAAVMVLLLVALWPETAATVRDVLTGTAVLLLTWSFSGDARFLLAHRRPMRA